MIRLIYHNITGVAKPNDLSFPFRLVLVSDTNKLLWNLGDVEIYQREDFCVLGSTKEELEKTRDMIVDYMKREGYKTIMHEIQENK